MKFLSKYADNTKSDSIVNKWRRKRFKHFENLIQQLPKPVKILDAGGTENFWLQMGYAGNEDLVITLLNTENQDTSFGNIKYIKGDAKDLSRFSDREFDVVFSNSVIEHVGSFGDQRQMANEVTRVGKSYFVQTPNYYFFMEPHFLFPFFQFLPTRIKIFLVTNFKMGWFEKCKTREEALQTINSVRLLKQNEFKKLFQGSVLLKERLFGFTKSFTAVSDL